MDERMNNNLMGDCVNADKLIRRLERFRDSLPSNAEMTVRGLVDVVRAIVEAEVKAETKANYSKRSD